MVSFARETKEVRISLFFSIIVPVYNTEKEFLVKCIKSIVEQSKSDMEVILIDDGSTEATARLCDYLKQNYDIVQTIHQNNKGLAGARNTGIEYAKGEWIIHVDSDDWLKPGLIEALYKKIQSGNYDIIVYGYEASDGKRTIVHKLNNKKVFDEAYANIKNDVLKAALKASSKFDDLAINTTWGKAYKKSFIVESEIKFNELLKRAQDVPYSLEVFSKANSVGFIDGTYYVYRADNLSLSRGYNPRNFERLTMSVQACKEFVEQYPEGEKLQEAIYTFARYCFISLIKTDFLNPRNPQTYSEKKQRFKKALSIAPYAEAFAMSRSGRGKFPGNIEEILISKKLFCLLKLYESCFKLAHRILKER